MDLIFMRKTVKLAVLSVLAAGLSYSAFATVTYNYNYTITGDNSIPQDGTTLSSVQTISGIGTPITSVQLVLTFNDSSSLTGNSSGIQGLLTLGTTSGSPSVGFYPTATSSSGAERIYTATFSGLDGYNPNGTWGLVLWDNGTSGIENGLVGWSLNITVVPEPVNVALGVLAGLVVVKGLTRRYISRRA